jgi:hypothetical protein
MAETVYSQLSVWAAAQRGEAFLLFRRRVVGNHYLRFRGHGVGGTGFAGNLSQRGIQWRQGFRFHQGCGSLRRARRDHLRSGCCGRRSRFLRNHGMFWFLRKRYGQQHRTANEHFQE